MTLTPSTLGRLKLKYNFLPERYQNYSLQNFCCNLRDNHSDKIIISEWTGLSAEFKSSPPTMQYIAYEGCIDIDLDVIYVDNDGWKLQIEVEFWEDGSLRGTRIRKDRRFVFQFDEIPIYLNDFFTARLRWLANDLINKEEAERRNRRINKMVEGFLSD